VPKNRKKSKKEGYIVPLPFTAMMVGAAILSLAYLRIDGKCDELGANLKTLETQTRELRRKCLYEESCWARMKSPRGLDEALRRWNLQMDWPRSDQIVRLSRADVKDALEEGLRENRPQYAQMRR